MGRALPCAALGSVQQQSSGQIVAVNDMASSSRAYQTVQYFYGALAMLQVPAAGRARRCSSVRARAGADQQPRSVASASVTKTKFSHIQKLISEQNRGQLAQVAKVCVVLLFRIATAVDARSQKSVQAFDA